VGNKSESGFRIVSSLIFSWCSLSFYVLCNVLCAFLVLCSSFAWCILSFYVASGIVVNHFGSEFKLTTTTHRSPPAAPQHGLGTRRLLSLGATHQGQPSKFQVIIGSMFLVFLVFLISLIFLC
jgi:hypothetical protein